MSEVQSADTVLSASGAVSGTLYYQDKFFDDFSAHEFGHFLCLDWLGGVASGEHMTITRNSVLFASEDLPEEIVLWVESNTDVYNIKVNTSSGENVCNITLNLQGLTLEHKKEPELEPVEKKRLTIARPGWGQIVAIIGSNPGAYYMNDLEYDGFRTEYNGNNCVVKDCKLIFNFGNTVPNHPEMSEGFYFPFYIAEAEWSGLAGAGKLTVKVNGEPQDYLDGLDTHGIKFIRFPDTANPLDTSAWAGMFKGDAYEPDLSITMTLTVGDEYETSVTFDDSVVFDVVVA